MHGDDAPQLVVETPTLEVRWSYTDRSLNRFLPWLQEFSADSRTLFTLSEDYADVIAYESETGNLRGRIRLLSDSHRIAHPTPDHRALLVYQIPGKRRETWIDRVPWMSRLLPTDTDCVIIIDMNAARERLLLTDWRVCGVQLSDDGNTLVTQHNDGIIRCWDVNAWKPLHWPIGVPAGLAVLGVLFAWWRGRRHV